MLELLSLKITDFRVIETADLEFDKAIIIIGENGSGKSTLLEALALILNPALEDRLPEFKEYHFRIDEEKKSPVNQLQIDLRLRLVNPQDASEQQHFEHFPRHLNGSTREAEQYIITFVSRYTKQGIQTSWRCLNMNDGAKSDSAILLGELRRLIPVIHLKPGALTGNLPVHNQALPDVSDSDKISQLKRQILSYSAEILQGDTTDFGSAVDNGFEAVKALAAEINPDASGSRPTSGLSLKLKEMLKMVSHHQYEHLSHTLDRFSQFTEKLGALMLVNALIGSSRGRFEKFSYPVLIIEDPEAHLHSKTLATIGNLLRKIQWQKIITTNSGLLLGEAPMNSIRRIRRKEGQILVNRVHTANYSKEDLRRISYHLRTNHNMATFARFWILVEGESEYWLLPPLARIMKREFLKEGIAVIDFAQTGLKPLLKFASDLDIGWHVLVDGDKAGLQYEKVVRDFLRKDDKKRSITKLKEKDIEHFLWDQGFDDVYTKAARLGRIPKSKLKPGVAIRRAIKNNSKPFLALSVVESVALRGVDSIPKPLSDMIEHCVEVARRN